MKSIAETRTQAAAQLSAALPMLLAASRDEGLDLAIFHGLDVGLRAVAAVGRHLGRRLAGVFDHRAGHGHQLAAVGGTVAQPMGDNHLALVSTAACAL